jgi:hypothetical protein
MEQETMTNADLPLIKVKPQQVPFGFSSPSNPVLVNRIVLAKEPEQ